VATNYPTALDDFPNPTGTTLLNASGSLKHSTQHTNINDALEAIEARVGIVSSSVATSIDSLAVGLSFSVLHIAIWIPALVIGIVATILTAGGLHLGCIVGAASRLGKRAEIAGGLVLVAIGLNILHEHGVF